MNNRDDALFQATFMAIHAAGAMFFTVAAVLSGLAGWYHAKRFWEEIR